MSSVGQDLRFGQVSARLSQKVFASFWRKRWRSSSCWYTFSRSPSQLELCSPRLFDELRQCVLCRHCNWNAIVRSRFCTASVRTRRKDAAWGFVQSWEGLSTAGRSGSRSRRRACSSCTRGSAWGLLPSWVARWRVGLLSWRSWVSA